MLRHSRREKEGLALALEVRHDRPHLLLEPHVDHPIRLIQSEVPAEVEFDALLGQEVHEAAGRRHRAVDPLVHQIALFAHIDTAHRQEDPQGREPPETQRVRVLLYHVVRLARKLPGGVDAQPERPLATHHGHLPLLLECNHDHRQREDQRLAGPSEGDSDHVASAETHGEPLHLDRRRALDPFRDEQIERGLRETHVFEVLDGRRDVIPLDDNVPLLPQLVTLWLRRLPDVPRGAPVGLHRLRVYDPLRELLHGHERLLVREVLHNLDVSLHLILDLLRHDPRLHHRRLLVEQRHPLHRLVHWGLFRLGSPPALGGDLQEHLFLALRGRHKGLAFIRTLVVSPSVHLFPHRAVRTPVQLLLLRLVDLCHVLGRGS
mmetsp:Transcript_52549/g.125148  ORF Transcript_52549/g.125148 Transcript_52549/m.125148 type:complete len:376 (+) Transcript_52549:1141-2268(+)